MKKFNELLNDVDNLGTQLEEKAGKSDLLTTNTNVSALEVSKATKTEVDVERKRIDSFTTLTSGSTTGDAELIDGMIGVDGNTYDNIGGAIRGQINIVNENFNLYDEALGINTQIISLSNFDLGGLTISSSGWVYSKFPNTKGRTKEGVTLFLQKGDTITISPKTMIYVGYKTKEGLYYTSGNLINGIYTIPTTAEYVMAIKNTDDTAITDLNLNLNDIIIEKCESTKRIVDELYRIIKLSDNGINYASTMYFEMGNMGISSSGWAYSDLPNTTVRTKEGLSLSLKIGDKIAVDSTLSAFIGWKNSNGIYKTQSWTNGVYEVIENGEYVLLIKNNDGSAITDIYSVLYKITFIKQDDINSYMINENGIWEV